VTTVLEPPEGTRVGSAPARPRRRALTGLVTLLAVLARLLVAAFLCSQWLGALLVVGWTSRLVRLRTWRRWAGRGSDWPALRRELVDDHGIELATGSTPRWLVAEDFRLRLSASTRSGRLPGRLRRVMRFPGLVLGSLAANLIEGLRVLFATATLTAPGCFLLMAGWKYGWDNSFYKGYEQAAIGPLTSILGILMLIAALAYLPAGWSHLAAAGRLRAFYDVRLLVHSIRARLASFVLFAATFSALTLPVTVAWVRVYAATNEHPWLADATREQIDRFRESYVLNSALFVGPIYVALHLLAAACYRPGLLRSVRLRPGLVDDLPPTLRGGLERLGLLPSGEARRRHPLLSAVLATGRRGTNALLWTALVTLWFTFVAQLYVAQFLHFHDFLVWLNPFLVHLPCPRWGW
jgi:hypothetical protein